MKAGDVVRHVEKSPNFIGVIIDDSNKQWLTVQWSDSTRTIVRAKNLKVVHGD